MTLTLLELEAFVNFHDSLCLLVNSCFPGDRDMGLSLFPSFTELHRRAPHNAPPYHSRTSLEIFQKFQYIINLILFRKF